MPMEGGDGHSSCLRWPVLSSPDRVQCAVLPASSARAHGPNGRIAPGDLFTTQQLHPFSPLRELYPQWRHLRLYTGPLPRTGVRGLAQYSVVFEPRIQPRIRIHRSLREAVAPRSVQGIPRDSARLRQYRLNGLVRWRIGTIIVLLPITLQVASVLFLAGIIVLLWTLHPTVAAVTTSLIALLFAFFLTVTIIPVFNAGCSYRSPASFAIYTIFRHTCNATMEATRCVCEVIIRWHTALSCGVPRVTRVHRFAHQRRYISTWRGRDHNEAHQQLAALDRAIVTTAYSTTGDTKFVSQMPVIFSDLPPLQVAKCFVDMCNFMEGEWGNWGIPRQLLEDRATPSSLTCYGLRHLLARTDEDSEAWSDDVYAAYQYFCLGDGTPTERFAELACKTLCQLAVEYPTYRALYDPACLGLRHFYDRQGARHSHGTMCHARAMLERELESWNPSRGFKAFQSHTAAIYVLLHCVRETVSEQSQLTPTQTEGMLAWGRDGLARVLRWLRELEWQGLHKGCLAVSGNVAGAVAFLHIASSHLIMDIIDPLLALSSTPEGLKLISEELISVVKHTWSSAQAAYPNPIDITQGADLVWCSGLDTIDAKLMELRAVVTGTPKEL
ncbi:hypothetical protein C8T65DRAFT_638029 [Cerioporus squamosus]|nr:hypothetical protein C8T65DRAFT_638029 [Cerioporus squamosus]